MKLGHLIDIVTNNIYRESLHVLQECVLNPDLLYVQIYLDRSKTSYEKLIVGAF